MNKEKAISIVKPFLTEERFAHTLRVTDEAEKLAKAYNEDVHAISLAAIFHDYAKYRPLEEMKRIIHQSYLPKDLLMFHHELWHGPVASILVEQEYGIVDKQIKQAIRYHTTGKQHMSNFEMIIFIADYIEPARDFPGVDNVRKAAEKSLELATQKSLQQTIQFLSTKNREIYPDTFHAYNDYTKKINGGFDKWKKRN